MRVFLLTSAQTETFLQFVSSDKFVFVAKITSQSFDFANKCNHWRRAYGVFLERRPEGGHHSANGEARQTAIGFGMQPDNCIKRRGVYGVLLGRQPQSENHSASSEAKQSAVGFWADTKEDFLLPPSPFSFVRSACNTVLARFRSECGHNMHIRQTLSGQTSHIACAQSSDLERIITQAKKYLQERRLRDSQGSATLRNFVEQGSPRSKLAYLYV